MRPTTFSSGIRTVNSLSRAAIPRTAATRHSILSHLSPSSITSTVRTPQRVFFSHTPARLNSSSSSSSSSSFSSSSQSNPLTDRNTAAQTDSQHEEQNRLRREQEPAYQISFTCKPCGNRSSHRMSKHGYHSGTVLIRCPSCANRHVISDHLNIFFDKKTTLEDILSEQGGSGRRQITRGYLDGDMEFWDDGTAFKRDGEGGSYSGQ